MGLETGTYINSLVPSNPTGADPRAQGDDHIRLIKSTIKNTFPNINGAMTATDEQLNSVTTNVANLGTTKADITYVDSQNNSQNATINTKAPLASPALTGVPTAPTAPTGTNNTQIATTAYAQNISLLFDIGQGQSWQDVTSQRAPGVSYTNNTFKPIQINVTFQTGSQVDVYSQCSVYVNGILVGTQTATARGSAVFASMQVIVPSGAVYSASGAGSYSRWTELR